MIDLSLPCVRCRCRDFLPGFRRSPINQSLVKATKTLLCLLWLQINHRGLTFSGLKRPYVLLHLQLTVAVNITLPQRKRDFVSCFVFYSGTCNLAQPSRKFTWLQSIEPFLRATSSKPHHWVAMSPSVLFSSFHPSIHPSHSHSPLGQMFESSLHHSCWRRFRVSNKRTCPGCGSNLRHQHASSTQKEPELEVFCKTSSYCCTTTHFFTAYPVEFVSPKWKKWPLHSSVMNRHVHINSHNISVSTCKLEFGFDDDDNVSKLAKLRRCEEVLFFF